MKGRGQNLKLVVHIAAVTRNFSAKESTHLTRFSSSVLQAINSQGAARGDQAPQLSGFDVVARVNPEIKKLPCGGRPSCRVAQEVCFFNESKERKAALIVTHAGSCFGKRFAWPLSFGSSHFQPSSRFNPAVQLCHEAGHSCGGALGLPRPG